MKTKMIELSGRRVLMIDYGIHYDYDEGSIIGMTKNDANQTVTGYGKIYRAQIIGVKKSKKGAVPLSQADIFAISKAYNDIRQEKEEMRVSDFEF